MNNTRRPGMTYKRSSKKHTSTTTLGSMINVLKAAKLNPNESCTSYINNSLELAQLAGLEDVQLRKSIIRGLPDDLKFHVNR